MSVFLANRDEPLYIQVAERIKGLIARNYQPGEVLPPYLQLTERYGVGLVTVKRAMDILAAKGIVTPIRRKGTVVNRRIRPGETRLGQVGLIVRSTINRLFEARYLGEIVGALALRLDCLGSNLRIFSLNRRSGPITPRDVVVAGVDGAVLLGVFDRDYIAAFAREDVPLVALDHHLDDVPLDYVVCDNAGATRAVLEHLVGLGHRRIAYAELFTTAPSWLGATDAEEAIREESDRVERREAFAAGMAELLPDAEAPRHVVVSAGPEDRAAGGERKIAELADAVRPEKDPPTAIVAESDYTAVGLIEALGRRGVRVPEDVSVAAIAGADMTAADIPPLTYCRVDFGSMGEKGMELLELRSRSPRPSEANVVRIGFEFTPGKTTSAPPGP